MKEDSKRNSVFSDFKRHFEQQGGKTPSEAEEAFMARIAPKVHKIARGALTREVRRAFDSNDITSTVLRRIVGCVRQGTIRLETEGQFMSLLKTMTKHAIVDKHNYLHSLLRSQDRQRSVDQPTQPSEDQYSGWDLTESDDVRRRHADVVPATPVDEVLFAEKTQALNELCAAVRAQLQADEWHLFKLRFLDETLWKEIAREMGIVDEDGKPSPDAARMRVNRIIQDLRPKLQKYEQWLRQRPTP